MKLRIRKVTSLPSELLPDTLYLMKSDNTLVLGLTDKVGTLLTMSPTVGGLPHRGDTVVDIGAGIYTIDCSTINAGFTLPDATGSQDRRIINYINVTPTTLGSLSHQSSDTINGVLGSVVIDRPSIVICVDAACNSWTMINSRTGRDGARGPTGLQGPQGSQGCEGPVGPAGIDGLNGIDGAKGDVGERGPQGQIGPMGPSGSSINPCGGSGGVGPQGPQGADGATGPQGPQGADGGSGSGSTGPQGADGNDGATGPQGPQGADGNDGATGPQGPQGFDGNDGATGPQGPQGADGNDGATGPQGPQGFDGAIGPQGNDGATGPQGPQGAAGSGGGSGGTPLNVVFVNNYVDLPTTGEIDILYVVKSNGDSLFWGIEYPPGPGYVRVGDEHISDRLDSITSNMANSTNNTTAPTDKYLSVRGAIDASRKTLGNYETPHGINASTYKGSTQHGIRVAIDNAPYLHYMASGNDLDPPLDIGPGLYIVDVLDGPVSFTIPTGAGNVGDRYQFAVYQQGNFTLNIPGDIKVYAGPGIFNAVCVYAPNTWVLSS